MSELGQDTSINFFQKWCHQTLKINIISRTTRATTSHVKSHGTARDKNLICTTLKWDITGLGYSLASASASYFTSALYLRYFPLLLYQTAILVNFMVGSKPFYPL